ncbi:aa3-type cytochrome c oxidase subunit IV [Epibacterium ulvae]|nr:aa3-type cytochrome c oxidase subunit IV [Epibacterium ulvae]
MAEHKHGSMDITVQEQAYAGFITAIVRCSIASIAALIFLAVFAI